MWKCRQFDCLTSLLMSKIIKASYYWHRWWPVISPYQRAMMWGHFPCHDAIKRIGCALSHKPLKYQARCFAISTEIYQSFMLDRPALPNGAGICCTMSNGYVSSCHLFFYSNKHAANWPKKMLDRYIQAPVIPKPCGWFLLRLKTPTPRGSILWILVGFQTVTFA